MITVECSEDGLDGKNHIRVGKLNLVDLAGSERQVSSLAGCSLHMCTTLKPLKFDNKSRYVEEEVVFILSLSLDNNRFYKTLTQN